MRKRETQPVLSKDGEWGAVWLDTIYKKVNRLTTPRRQSIHFTLLFQEEEADLITSPRQTDHRDEGRQDADREGLCEDRDASASPGTSCTVLR